MADADRVKWNSKYAGDAYVMSDRPARLLASIAEHLPRTGRALEIACGEGHATVWLAERGLAVDAVDISAAGLAKVRRLAEASGVEERVRTIEHDLDAGLPPEAGAYDLVFVTHFYAPDLVPALRAALAPGGVFVAEILTRANLALDVRVPSARFLAAEGELRSWAAGLEILISDESVVNDRHRALIVARAPRSASTPCAGR